MKLRSKTKQGRPTFRYCKALNIDMDGRRHSLTRDVVESYVSVLKGDHVGII